MTLRMSDYSKIYDINFPYDPDFISALDQHIGNSITNKYLRGDFKQQLDRKKLEEKMSFFGSGGSGGGLFFGRNTGANNQSTGSTNYSANNGGGFFGGGNSGVSTNNRSGSAGFFNSNNGASGNNPTDGGFFGGGKAANSNQQSGSAGFFNSNNGASGNSSAGFFSGANNSGGNSSGGSFFGNNTGNNNGAGNSSGGGIFSGNPNNSSSNKSAGSFFSSNSTTNSSNNSNNGGFFSGGSNTNSNSQSGGGGFFSGGSSSNQQGNNNGGFFNNSSNNSSSGGGYLNNSSGSGSYLNNSSGTSGYLNSGNQTATSSAAQYLQALLPNSTIVVYQTPTQPYQTQGSYAMPVNPTLAGYPMVSQPNSMPWVEPTVPLSWVQKELKEIMQNDSSIKTYQQELSKAKIDYLPREDHFDQSYRSGIYSSLQEGHIGSSTLPGSNPLHGASKINQQRKVATTTMWKSKPCEQRETIDDRMKKDRLERQQARTQQELQRDLRYEDSYYRNAEATLVESHVVDRQPSNFNLNRGLQDWPNIRQNNNQNLRMEPEVPLSRDQPKERDRWHSQQPQMNHVQKHGRISNLPGLPRLTKPGYMTKPTIEQLKKLNPEYLTEIRDFEVYNEFGAVKFYGTIDVSDLDLDRDVFINHGGVEVYPDDLYYSDKSLKKPEVGSKLNRPALISLCNIKPKYPNDPDANTSYFKSRCEQIGATFFKYTPQSMLLQFEVEHFTKYSLNDECDQQGSDEDTTANRTTLPTSSGNVLNSRATATRVALLDQVRQRTVGNPKPTMIFESSPQGLEDLDLSAIHADRFNEFPSFDLTAPASRITPPQSSRKAPEDLMQETISNQLPAPMTTNQLLEELERHISSDGLDTALPLEEPEEEPIQHDRKMLSIVTRQLSASYSERTIGRFQSKSGFTKRDFFPKSKVLQRVDLLSSKAEQNLEATVFQALRTVARISQAEQTGLPQQSSFGIEPSIQSQFLILEKKRLPYTAWSVKKKDSFCRGTLTRLQAGQPRGGQSALGARIERLQAIETGEVYEFSPEQHEGQTWNETFGGTLQVLDESGSVAPKIFKIPLYISQVLASRNYKEAILFEAVNILFGLPKFRVKKAFGLTLAGFQQEAQEHFNSYCRKSSVTKAEDTKRHFGLLIRNFLQMNGSRSVFLEGKFWDSAEDFGSSMNNLLALSTFDFGGLVENLDACILVPSRGPSVQTNLQKIEAVMKNRKHDDFFELLLEVLARFWKSETLHSILEWLFEKQLQEPRKDLDLDLYLIIKCWYLSNCRSTQKVSDCVTRLRKNTRREELLAWMISVFLLKDGASTISTTDADTIRFYFEGFINDLKEKDRIEDTIAIICCSISSGCTKLDSTTDSNLHDKLKETCVKFSSEITKSSELRTALENYGVPKRMLLESIAYEMRLLGKEDEAISFLLKAGEIDGGLHLLLGYFSRFSEMKEGELMTPTARILISLFENHCATNTSIDRFFNSSILPMLVQYFDIIHLIENSHNESEIRNGVETFISGWCNWKTFNCDKRGRTAIPGIQTLRVNSVNRSSSHSSLRSKLSVSAEINHSGTNLVNYFDIAVNYEEARTLLYTGLLSEIFCTCTRLIDDNPILGLEPVLGVPILLMLQSEDHQEVMKQFSLSTRYIQQLISSIISSRDIEAHVEL